VKPALKLVDLETGEVPADGCPNCAAAQMDLELVHKQALKRERDLLKQIHRLKQEQERDRLAYARKTDVLEVWEHFRAVTGKTRSKLTADRFDAIKAALEGTAEREGYTVEELKLSVEGIAAYPYVVNGQRCERGAENQRHDDVVLAVTVGKRVEKLANLGHQVRKAQA
jgi:uncharacterized Zn finger protein (UPF0148 family)